MPEMRFSRVCLLSQNERKGFVLTFGDRPTIIQGPNGFGKSALLKSLYDAFAAAPHKIDSHWREARVYTLVEFSVDKKNFKMLKAGDVYAVFDTNDQLLIRTTEISKELSPFLAAISSFHLIGTDRRGDTVIPPPAYIFAPYYIDQDSSWSVAWSSFIKMYLPRSAALLAEYHSGIRPNEYYIAQSERDRLAQELKQVERRREVADNSLAYIRSLSGDIVLDYNEEVFAVETERLLEQSVKLNHKQTRLRDRCGKLANEAQAWLDQISVIKAAIADSRAALYKAVKRPDHINCPMCGQEYENSITEQFGLVENHDQLVAALIKAQEKHRHLENELSQLRGGFENIKEDLTLIETILDTKRSDISFRDVVVSRGRMETENYITQEIYKNDVDIVRLSKDVSAANARMKSATSRKRSSEIRSFFSEKLHQFANSLDVRMGTGRLRLDAPTGGRGSEGPRSKISYYYAFLHTARKYTTSAYCPIVIDAPNQQGQDKVHIAQIIDFIINDRPPGSQLILGIEDIFQVKDQDVDVVVLSGPRNHLLKEEFYTVSSEIMRPLLANLL